MSSCILAASIALFSIHLSVGNNQGLSTFAWHQRACIKDGYLSWVNMVMFSDTLFNFHSVPVKFQQNVF